MQRPLWTDHTAARARARAREEPVDRDEVAPVPRSLVAERRPERAPSRIVERTCEFCADEPAQGQRLDVDRLVPRPEGRGLTHTVDNATGISPATHGAQTRPSQREGRAFEDFRCKVGRAASRRSQSLIPPGGTRHVAVICPTGGLSMLICVVVGRSPARLEPLDFMRPSSSLTIVRPTARSIWRPFNAADRQSRSTPSSSFEFRPGGSRRGPERAIAAVQETLRHDASVHIASDQAPPATSRETAFSLPQRSTVLLLTNPGSGDETCATRASWSTSEDRDQRYLELASDKHDCFGAPSRLARRISCHRSPSASALQGGRHR